MVLALSFLGVIPRQGKPRTTGLTIVRDPICPLEEQRQFLETYAPFVDYAKLSNISAALYSETFIDAKIALYRAYDVTPLFGGIVFENAYVQGKVDEFVAYVAGKKAARTNPREESGNRLMLVSRLTSIRYAAVGRRLAGLTCLHDYHEQGRWRHGSSRPAPG